MQVQSEKAGNDYPQSVSDKLGDSNAPGVKVKEPDDYWRRRGFAAKYTRNLVDGLSKHKYIYYYSTQCMMALAQGIKYLCDEAKIILDAGCGPALRTIEMQGLHISNAVIVGCDYSEEMLSHAEQIMEKIPEEKRVRIDKANVYELPYDDDAFDAVYCYGLLMSLRKPQDGLAELMRVSQRGLVCIEEVPEVMDMQQLKHWKKYKEELYPGRVYWHSYLNLFAPYKNTVFTPLSTEPFQVQDDGREAAHRIAPGYARFIVEK